MLRGASPRAPREMTKLINKKENWGPLDRQDEIDRRNEYTYNNITMITMFNVHG